MLDGWRSSTMPERRPNCNFCGKKISPLNVSEIIREKVVREDGEWVAGDLIDSAHPGFFCEECEAIALKAMSERSKQVRSEK
jgi:hypothetical protein